MENKENKQIKTISIVVVLTFIGKVLGLARDMLLGYNFATGMESNAFLTASRIPRNFFDIIFASAISASFIPVFNEYLQKKGKEEAFKLSNAFITIVGILTAAISALGMIFSGQITSFLADGFDSETAALCASLLKILFPAIIFTGLAFCIVGILQSFGEFNIPALLSTATNAIVIIYYLVFCRRFGIYGLAVAFLVGWAAQFVMQLPSLKKTGFVFRPSLKHEGVKKIFLLMLPILVSTWVQPVNSMIATKFASHLNGGAATSAFDYANTLYTIIAGVLVLSISNVVFPEFSRMSISGDNQAFKTSLCKTMNGMMYLIVPMSFGLSAVATPLIRLFYERGAWGTESTQLTAGALSILAIGMIGYGIQIILTRAFYAEQKSIVPLICGITAVLFNVLLCIYLSPRFGIKGLAAASVVSTLLADLVLLKYADKRFGGLLSTEAFTDLIKILVSSAVMWVCVYLGSSMLKSHFSDGIIGRIIVLFVPVALGIIVYAILTLILGVSLLKNLHLWEKWQNTSAYKLYRRFSDFVYRAWDSSATVNLVCRQQGRIWKEEGSPLKLWKKLTDRFAASKLKTLFTGSIFLQGFIWCALAVFAAPVLPTMLDLMLCLAGYASVVLSSLYDNKSKLKTMPMTWPLVVYSLIFIAATLLSSDIASSMLVCVLTVAFVMFAVVLYYSVDTKKQFDFLIEIMIVGAVLVSAYGIIQYVFRLGYQSAAWVDDDMFSSITFRVASTLENPNMLGNYLILAIPLGGARFLESKGIKKLYYFGCCAVMCLCIILTFSRGAWLGLMFVALIFVLFLKPQLMILAPFALVALYFVLPDTIVSRFTSIGNLRDNSTSYRVSIWLSSIALLMDGNWIKGIGPGNETFTKYFRLYAYDQIVAPHSHNLYLQLMCEGGILLLLVFLFAVIVCALMLCKSIRYEKDPRSKYSQVACLSAIGGFCLQAMTDYSFYNKRLMLLFFVFIALSALAARRSTLKEGGVLR